MTNTTSSSAFVANRSILNSDSFNRFGFSMAITMGIILLITTIILIIYYFHCMRNNIVDDLQRLSTSAMMVELDDVEQGIDETILKSYPTVMYCENEMGSTRNDINCSICLCDYKDFEMVRLLPDCGHLFHVGCVDEWLRRHPTCPICRSTPLVGSY